MVCWLARTRTIQRKTRRESSADARGSHVWVCCASVAVVSYHVGLESGFVHGGSNTLSLMAILGASPCLRGPVVGGGARLELEVHSTDRERQSWRWSFRRQFHDGQESSVTRTPTTCPINVPPSITAKNSGFWIICLGWVFFRHAGMKPPKPSSTSCMVL